MAIYYKRSSITTLDTNTAWDSTGPTGPGPAGPPTVTDTAQWDASSLGGTLNGSFGANPLQFNSASGVGVIHASGTITLGPNGINTTNSSEVKTFIANNIDVGSNDQTWTMYGNTGLGVVKGDLSSIFVGWIS